MRERWGTRAVVVATCAAALLLAAPGCSRPGGGSASQVLPAEARAAVDRLEVRPIGASRVDGYERDAFGDGWDYDPSTGCSTRERVLIEESLTPVATDDRCRPSGGSWRSAYDGATTNDPADLQIDHLVPLADAWRSGAATWSDERRRAFANDLDHPAALTAVTGHANQSKGDATPDAWLPEDPRAWCDYASDWVAVKGAWDLSVAPAEKAALVTILAGCS